MRCLRTLSILLLAAALLLSACAPKAASTQTPQQAARPTSTSRPATAQPAARPATAVPTFGKPTTSAGTALGWYPVAEKAALAWKADAVVYSVVGGNTSRDGSSLPCDGKAEQWTYSFVSVSAKESLTVYVVGGAVSSQGGSALTRPDGSPYTQGDLEQYIGLYPTADWKVDSAAAIQTANVPFQAKYNVEPRNVAYVWFNGKYLDIINDKATNWMRWVLSYDPEKYPFQVTLDALTGEVKARP
jgi:hypothetical protein